MIAYYQRYQLNRLYVASGAVYRMIDLQHGQFALVQCMLSHTAPLGDGWMIISPLFMCIDGQTSRWYEREILGGDERTVQLALWEMRAEQVGEAYTASVMTQTLPQGVLSNV